MQIRWRFYFPGDGETKEDAIEAAPATQQWWIADDAAKHACEYDYDNRYGCERDRGEEFDIAVISPQGKETIFIGSHEPSIYHSVVEKRACK